MKILIDFDGTLLDNHALFYSHIHIYPQVKGFRLKSTEESLLYNMPLYGVGTYYKKYYLPNLDIQEIIEEMNNLLIFSYHNYSSLREGALDLIKFLKKNNHELYICSDSQKESVLIILSRLDLSKFFKLIDVNEDYLKSHEGYWELVIDKYNFKRNQLILIDDSLQNIINAKNSSIKSIGCRNFPFNISDEKELRKCSDLYVDYFDSYNFKEIESLIRRMSIE